MPPPAPPLRSPAAAPEAARLKVFVSYSRVDSRIAAEIRAGLDFDGRFDVLMDSSSIHEGEAWKARLSALIDEADTVVVLLSRPWVDSAICQWELEEALAKTKRVVPVQHVPLVGVNVPARLAALNYVRFDQAPDGTPRLLLEAMASLRRALVTDLDWVREHARLQAKAREWEAAGRMANRMLVGSDIPQAKHWMERQPAAAPPLTELQRDYIAASEQAEAARQSADRRRAEMLQRAYGRARIALVVASTLFVVAAAAGGYAYVQKGAAQTAAQVAAQQRDAALRVQSRHLAGAADERREEGDAVTAIHLALAGLPGPVVASPLGSTDDFPATRPAVPQAEGSQLAALLTRTERRVLDARAGIAHAVAFSPDGQAVAVAAADGRVRLWSIDSPAAPRVIEGNDGPVLQLVFSADGDRLWLASANRLRAVALRSGVPDAVIEHPLGDAQETVQSMALTADGQRLAVGGDGGSLRLWTPGRPQADATLKGHTGAIAQMAFTPDGRALISASADASVRLWDAVTGRPRGFLPADPARGHTLAVTGVAIAADGRHALTIAADMTLRQWALPGGKPMGEPLALDSEPTALALRADGSVLVGRADGDIEAWDLTDRRVLQRWSGHPGAVTALAWHGASRLLASSARDGTARLWSQTPAAADRLARVRAGVPSSLAVSADGRVLAWAQEQPRIGVWTDGAAAPAELAVGPSPAAAVALDATGTRLASGHADGAVRVWELASSRLLREWRGHTGAITSLAFSPDGQRLVSGSADQTARIWPLGADTPPVVLQPHATRVHAVAFAPDGARVLTAAGSTARLWNTADGQQQAVLAGHAGPVIAVAFSPDGRQAATGGRDASVRLWDLSTAKALHVLKADRTGSAQQVAFDPDGGRLLSAWSDGHLRIATTASGEWLADVPLQAQALLGLAMPRGGQRVALLGAAGDLLWLPWPQELQAQVAWARAQVPRCPEPAQWRRVHLGPTPPRWCITGPAGEAATDPAAWKPLWPYDTDAWRRWQQARDQGQPIAAPGP